MRAATKRQEATGTEESHEVIHHERPLLPQEGREHHVMIPCRIYEGMFSSEWAVEVESVDGDKGSLFVHKSLVTSTSQDSGHLHVRLVHADEPGTSIVLLPQPAQGTGSWLRVLDSQLMTVPK